MAFRHVVGQLLPYGRFHRFRIDQAHGRDVRQIVLREPLEIDHLAIESGLPLLAIEFRGQGLGQEQGVILTRLGSGHQDPPRGFDLDGQEPHVVLGQTVLAYYPNKPFVRAHVQRLDAKVDLPRLARPQRNVLLAPFLWIAILVQQMHFDRSVGGFVLGRRFDAREGGFDLQRPAVGEHLPGKLHPAQGVVGRLPDAHVDQLDRHARGLGDLFLQRRGRIGGPGRPGKVGEDVDLSLWQGALGKQSGGPVEHLGQGLRIGHRLEPPDSLPHDPGIVVQCSHAGPRVEHGNLRAAGQLVEHPEAQLFGHFQPGTVFVPVLHTRSGIEDQGGSHRGFLAAETAAELHARLGQGEGQQPDRTGTQRQ